ncbi:hypothetical protein [Isoptericola hypogeus]
MDETLAAIRRRTASMTTAGIVELRSVAADGDVIEVRFSDRRDAGRRLYRGRARLTGPDEEAIAMGDVLGFEEWAEWNVVLPMVEALVTGAARGSSGDWIDLQTL